MGILETPVLAGMYPEDGALYLLADPALYPRVRSLCPMYFT